MKRDSMVVNNRTSSSKKRKTRAFCQAKDRYGAKTAFRVKPGMPGILVFTGREQERQSIRECNDLFNAVAKELYPELEAEVESADDVETSIANEIESLKKEANKKTHKFSSIKTQIPCISYLMVRDPIEPVSFVHRLLNRVLETGITGTRYISRLLPLSDTCYANMKDIEHLATKLLEPDFRTPDPTTNKITPKTFAVACNSRLCSQVGKDEIIGLVVSLVGATHKVDLTKPELTVVVEIFKNICGISVVRDFHELKKYNIQLVGQLGREKLSAAAHQESDNSVEKA
ncbi:hypothetical protein L0F63_005534 [Massospora cicadina]|nr:hypothetical protein L0F63_005534 [Massospora cicadina]